MTKTGYITNGAQLTLRFAKKNYPSLPTILMSLIEAGDWRISGHVSIYSLIKLQESILQLLGFLWKQFLEYLAGWLTRDDTQPQQWLGYGLRDRGTVVQFPASERDYSLLQRVQIGSATHPPLYSMETAVKAAVTLSWSLSSYKCCCYGFVELHRCYHAWFLVLRTDKFTPTPGWETLHYDLFKIVPLSKNTWPNNTL